MGKNKKPKSIGRLIVDLTPLLDVIFIVLIVILAGQDNYSTQADVKYAEAEKYVSEVNAEMEEIDAQNSVLKEQMSAYSSMNEYFNVVHQSFYSGDYFNCCFLDRDLCCTAYCIIFCFNIIN